jgi:hypothetical protein
MPEKLRPDPEEGTTTALVLRQEESGVERENEPDARLEPLPA